MSRRLASVLVGLTVSGAAAPLAEAQVTVPERFAHAKLNGTNGYRVSITGYERFVHVSADARDGGVMYVTDNASVTRQRVRAELGPVATVDLRFHPRGEPQRLPLPGRCQGRTTRRRGFFSGSVAFEAEGGLTSAHAERAKGAVITSTARCEPVPISPADPDPAPAPRHTRATVLTATSRDGKVSFQALRRDDTHQTEYFATVEERRYGLQIHHYATAQGPDGGFHFSLEHQRGKVAPPQPFSGFARYEADSGGTGDLTATLPGGEPVGLTGPNFDVWVLRVTTYALRHALRLAGRALES